MKTMKRLSSVILVLGLMIISPLSLASLPAEVKGKAVPSIAPMLKHVMPAVVNIYARGKIEAPQSPFAEPGDAPKDSNSGRFESFGSGVIINAKHGYVLTNAHVIDQAKTIRVTLNDGRRYRAKVKGVDQASDIAILQIDAPNLEAIKFGDSSQLKVGDFVVAIGSPFGLNQTVTSGIVSALQRDDLRIEGYEDFIQTDAPINPGNSGGALVNLNGQFIGMNTAILAPSGGNVGIGFAIPANMVKNVAEQLIKYGSISRGVAGIMIQTLTPELAKAFKVTGTKGAVITSVSPESPAAKAGLKSGDIIESINGHSVDRAGQVRNAIGLERSGSKIDIKVLRGKKLDHFKLVTADPTAYKAQKQAMDPFLNGVLMRNFDATVPNFGHIKGVQIVHANDSSPAWQSGLRSGDVIISANMKRITDMQQLHQAISNKQSELLLNILRKNGAAFFVVKR